ncbi:Histone-lysine N-methyltransferase SETMAR, partial [Stegodyphus mimosarum]
MERRCVLNSWSKEEVRAVIRYEWARGVSGTELHNRLVEVYGPGVMSKQMVRRWCRTFSDGRQQVEDIPRAGQTRTATTDANVRKVDDMIRVNRRITIDEVAEELGISHERAQNIIHDIFRYRKVSARWAPRQLTSTHKEQRMGVSLEHLMRYHEDCNDFLFRIVTFCFGLKRGSIISRQNRRPHLWSGNIRHHLSERSSRQLPLQSKFALEPDDKRIRIRCEQRTRNQSQNITEHHSFRGGSIMVWAGISLGYRTDLHMFKRGSLKAVWYPDEILEPIVRLYAAAVGHTFVLMDDNARPHRADIVDDYLESEGIARITGPAYLSDLNPIENLWDALGRAASSRFPPLATLIELKTALQEERRLLNSAVVDHLIESIVTRCKLCIQMRGDHIPY